LYVIATAQTGTGGQYSTLIKRGATTIASVIEPVTDTATSELEGYVFTTTLPAAGNYSLQLRDFAFPQPFTTLSASASQGEVIFPATLSGAGTLAINNAVAGPISIAVLAKLTTSNAAGFVPGGLFGINLTASGSSTALLEKTQGVGGNFVSIDVALTSADDYSIGSTDFAAPLLLAQLRGAVTRGATLAGSIYGGGTFGLDATPGTYTLNFLSTPQASLGIGMYGVSAATAPVVTLTSSASSVGSGGTVSLTWSASDADSCTASGGWSGDKATNGTATTGAISSNTTYTLTCVGAGGSSAKSATVTIQAAASGSGGGGSISLLMLLSLGLLVSARRLARLG
jgi:hypothetical protein